MTYRVNRASDRYYVNVGPQHECAYCGEPAECRDHATPATWLSGHLHLTESHRFYTVSCCHDCNFKASKWFDVTFLARRKRIAAIVRRENRALIATPQWSPSELDEMGPLMKAEVMKAMRGKPRVKRRLAMLESRVLPHGVPNELLQPIVEEADAWENA